MSAYQPSEIWPDHSAWLASWAGKPRSAWLLGGAEALDMERIISTRAKRRAMTAGEKVTNRWFTKAEQNRHIEQIVQKVIHTPSTR